MHSIDQREQGAGKLPSGPSDHTPSFLQDAAGFFIRPAASCDLSGIMEVMEEAASDTAHPEWFVSDDAAYVEEHLEKKGFVVVAEEKKTGVIAGFFMIKFPQEGEWHPGLPLVEAGLLFAEEAKERLAVMDSAAVRASFRGHRLQARMLLLCEERLRKEGLRTLVCTIHPDNRFSRKNMEGKGYQVMLRTICYGDKDRLILMKQLGGQTGGNA